MISVTIPICNEAGSVPELYARVQAALVALDRPWELVLVNDGSTDGSEELLDGIAARDPHARVFCE